MTAPQGVTDAEGEVVYLDTLKVAQNATDGLLGAILGPTVERLLDCDGGCGRRLLAHYHWKQFSKEKRKRLTELNVHRKEARGCCWKCAPGAPAPAHSGWRNKTSILERVDFPALWEKTRSAGGSYGELAADLGVSREYVRQVVKELGLPQVDRRKDVSAERDVFIEEMERLVTFGLGVYALAKTFGLTADEFVEKVGKLRERGLTAVRFDFYMAPHGTSQKEAA